MKEKVWEVYMVLSSSGKLYTGISNDVERRFEEHASGRRGARFFRTTEPVAVVYREICADRSAASQREYQIKQMSRQQKLAMIEKTSVNQ